MLICLCLQGLTLPLVIYSVNCCLDHWHARAPQCFRNSWVEFRSSWVGRSARAWAVSCAPSSSQGLIRLAGLREWAPFWFSALPSPASLLELGNWWRGQVSQREQGPGHQQQKSRTIPLGGVGQVPGTNRVWEDDHGRPSPACMDLPLLRSAENHKTQH